MKAEVLTVTPEIARKYLGGNILNRPINRKRVQFYASQIQRGIWKLNHQGIAITEGGRLIDGQHRLMAIIETEVPVEMMVITGAPEESFDTLDAGMSRSLKDRTGIHKEYVSICTLFYRIAFGESGAIAANDIEYIYEQLESSFDAFTPYKTVIRKGISIAPIQGAVIMHLAEGHGVYPAEQYNALVNLHFDKMEPRVQGFYKQTVNGKITGSSSDRILALARAYTAFNEEDKNTGSLAIKDEEYWKNRITTKLNKILDI